MKIDGHPFPADTNTVEIINLNKGKAKVLTSARAKESGAVDPRVQLLADEYKEARMRLDVKKNQHEKGESSRTGAMRPCITSRILLNKWQHQQEKDYQRWLEEKEYRHQCREER